MDGHQWGSDGPMEWHLNGRSKGQEGSVPPASPPLQAFGKLVLHRVSNICDEGRPEIHFQRWVSVIVDPNQQVIDQYTAEKKKKISFHFYLFRISLKDASFKINKKLPYCLPIAYIHIYWRMTRNSSQSHDTPKWNPQASWYFWGNNSEADWTKWTHYVASSSAITHRTVLVAEEQARGSHSFTSALHVLLCTLCIVFVKILSHWCHWSVAPKKVGGVREHCFPS